MDLNLTDPQLVSNFRVTKDEPDEAIVSSITADLTHGCQYRYGISTVKNIGAGVSLQHPPVNPTGTRMLFQYREIMDIGTAAVPAEAPVTVTVTITAPQSSAITGAVLEAQLVKCLSGLIHESTQANTQDVLNALIRGALVPKGL